MALSIYLSFALLGWRLVQTQAFVSEYVVTTAKIRVRNNVVQSIFFASTSNGEVSQTSNSSPSDACDVVVFGGGFGGLYTALELSKQSKRRNPSDIVLIEPSNQFVFLPLLYDLVMGTATSGEVCPTYKEILEGTGIRHIRASLVGLNATSQIASICDTNSGELQSISFKSAVVAVGASPESTLKSVPGAKEFAQPFYTQQDAFATRLLLNNLKQRKHTPRIAVIGGGYGGVELAASVKRKLMKADVTLLTRGPPMHGTRAESWVNNALESLGVNVEVGSVNSLKAAEQTGKVLIERTRSNDGNDDDCSIPWDAVLWTAGSGPAYPVCENIEGLAQTDTSGRLKIDTTLQCMSDDMDKSSFPPPVWSLGDCSEMVGFTGPATPKTAQAAMQQADVVAHNVLCMLREQDFRKPFVFQDLGSMLTLGGPNAAVLAPREGTPLGPLFAPLIDTARVGLGLADQVLSAVGQSPIAEKMGIKPAVDNLGLSLGGWGLGMDSSSASGSLSGTLTGAARRAVYAARMPTNRQRAYAVTSAAISTATLLAKEASEQVKKV